MVGVMHYHKKFTDDTRYIGVLKSQSLGFQNLLSPALAISKIDAHITKCPQLLLGRKLAPTIHAIFGISIRETIFEHENLNGSEHSWDRSL